MERAMAGVRQVPPNSVEQALEFVENGGRLVVRTVTHTTVIDRRVLNRFKRVDAWLLRADGDGYRLRQGQGSVYLLPGQLEYIIEG